MLFGFPITGETVAYFVLALIIITSGVFLMTLRNVMHMALALGGVFLGVAGIFIILGADFVGIVQVMIYAGAITILMVFSLMLTHSRRKTDEEPEVGGLRGTVTFIGVAVVVGAILLVVRKTSWPVSPTALQPFHQSTVLLIADALFHTYTIQFELVSAILTAALVGAVIIARKEEQ